MTREERIEKRMKAVRGAAKYAGQRAAQAIKDKDVKQRVLIDKHHADLFYGLQLLGDRLGWTIYTPIGHDWWDEGYWRFGEGYGDDRLAQQFLTGESAMWDTHHPERLIRGMTLDEARQANLTYVVATVQDNQRGMKRFADEVGARFVLQVGNTRQAVDWELDPLALVSSEVEIKGRGIRYHQELPAAFKYHPPTDQRTVRSFVNCFDSTPCVKWLNEARLFIEGPVYTYGIDEPDGNIETTDEIASLMAASGWGWHDKVQGDGFGHVLHDWAAIGRPIIGHASHYAGLLGEGLWEDGVTCLDLDIRSPEDTARIINTISVEDHERMCRAIRERFERIDYDAEAKAIRAFLG